MIHYGEGQGCHPWLLWFSGIRNASTLPIPPQVTEGKSEHLLRAGPKQAPLLLQNR